jgi:hypothetical protein
VAEHLALAHFLAVALLLFGGSGDPRSWATWPRASKLQEGHERGRDSSDAGGRPLQEGRAKAIDSAAQPAQSQQTAQVNKVG